jgi:hypothetical protein
MSLVDVNRHSNFANVIVVDVRINLTDTVKGSMY